jgi:hypothetical protein
MATAVRIVREKAGANNRIPGASPRKKFTKLSTALRTLATTLTHRKQGGPLFATIRGQADLLSEAAHLLSKRAEQSGAVDAVPLLESLRNRSIELETALTAALHKSTFAPYMQEDVRAISTALTTTLQRIVNVAVLPPDLPKPAYGVLCKASAGCADALCGILTTLPHAKDAADHAHQIAVRARAAEFLQRESDAKLLLMERDPIRVLQRMQISRMIRALFRAYRATADTIACTILKNG